MPVLTLVGEFKAVSNEAPLEFVPDGKALPLFPPPEGLSDGVESIGWSAILATAAMATNQEVTITLLDVCGSLWIIAPFAFFGHFKECYEHVDRAVGTQGPLALFVGISAELDPEQSSKIENGILAAARAAIGPRPCFQVISTTMQGDQVLFHSLEGDQPTDRSAGEVH